LKAYAKGFDFKEIPSRLMLQLCFAGGKKTISKERGKSSSLRKELEDKQAKGRIGNIKRYVREYRKTKEFGSRIWQG
jgi:hypothetical protein